MADAKSSRRSGRRRRRRPRRPRRRDKSTVSVSKQAVSAQEKGREPAQDEQALPEVFIYTYTIYKTDG